MQLDGVKNIIFDLGGVIINLDEEITRQAFKQLFPKNFEELYSYLIDNSVLQLFETGEITTDDFINVFKKFDKAVLENDILKAWNAMLLDIPIERIFLIRKLARKYRIFLLSNTNTIHLAYIDEIMRNDFGFDNLSCLFEKAYYSHQLNLRKPNPEIFSHVLSDKDLNPNETMFIDDSKEHVECAKGINIRAHQIKQNGDITILFNED